MGKPVVSSSHAQCWDRRGKYLGKSISNKSSVHGVCNKLVIEGESELDSESVVRAMFPCERDDPANFSSALYPDLVSAPTDSW